MPRGASKLPAFLLFCFAAFLFPTAPAAADAPPSSATTLNALTYPNGLALDRDGNLFISDVGSHRIFKLDRAGTLAVFAGTGEPGFSGDGGAAASARLNAPFDLAFDVDGSLLVADTYNHRIRRIDAVTGVISTLVGSGKSGPAGSSTTTTTGNGTTAAVPALSAALNNPQGLALDRDGNFYIADSYNHVVRRLDRKSNTVSVFAGTEAGLAGDNGPATKAQLNLPQAVAVAPDGSVYVSDSANSRIRRVRPDRTIQTIAGSGPGSGEGGAGFGGDGGLAEKAKLFSPTDLKFNALGQLYVVDSGNNRVRLIAHGVMVTVAGSGPPGATGDGGSSSRGTLNTPQKIAVAPDGTIYVADRVNRRVRKITPDGTISTVAGSTSSAGIMVDPSVLAKEGQGGS